MASGEVIISGESSRKNGWSLPLHPLQVCGWVAVFFLMLIYFTTMVPALPANWQAPAYAMNVIAGFAVVVTMVMATTINPSDAAVRAKSRTTVVELDRSKHPHAIENQFCYLCQVNVGVKSKHCRACNKCIADFDHHCKWLNNCVGGRNYKWFLSSLVTAGIGTIIILTAGITEFICFFVDANTGYVLQPYIVANKAGGNETGQFSIMAQPVPAEAWVTVVAMTTALAVVTLVLITHLFFFHVWLMCQGISTYDYIVRLREKDALEDAQRNSTHPNTSRASAARANKVTPSRTATDIPGQHSAHLRSEQALEEYRRALERADQADGGETPPPLSSPLHRGEEMNTNITAVKKLKKKKKKQDTSGNHLQVATVGVHSLYTEGQEAKEGGMGRRPLPSIHKAKKSKNSAATTQPACRSESEDSAIDADEDTLNTTHMFTLNSSSRLLEDGSLDYSTPQAFAQLPLTPHLLRPDKGGSAPRKPEVPPLDLTALRASSDSVRSSLNYQPYSATVRSTDTYRPGDWPPQRPYLGPLPEAVQDIRL